MRSLKTLLALLLLFVTACAKEIYTNEDATNSMRESQKTGLTVLLRDISNQTADMSGFKISTTQCGELIEGVTNADGIADMLIVKGDAALQITKNGYVSTTAIVTGNADGKERNNTVVIIPVFSESNQSGDISGTVSLKTSPVQPPLVNASMSIEIDIDELMRLANGGNTDKYCPGALSYSLPNMMQPIRTDASGAFLFKIPFTGADITYIINVHETALTQNTFLRIDAGGQDSQPLHIQLTPYGK
jgi:hypothetical protein